jgi:hypothetical protein
MEKIPVNAALIADLIGDIIRPIREFSAEF